MTRTERWIQQKLNTLKAPMWYLWVNGKPVDDYCGKKPPRVEHGRWVIGEG